MRIAINVLSVQSGGGLTFLKNLLKYLPLVGPDNEYIILVTEVKASTLGVTNGRFPNFRTMICPARGWAVRGCWEQTVMPEVLRREKVDVLYAPGNQGPVLSLFPFVVLVQNVEPLVQKGIGIPLALGMKRKALRIMTRASVHRARRVIAISEYTRRLLTREFSYSPERVTVIPHGAPEDSGTFPSTQTSAHHGGPTIENPYFLAVSNIKYNKNFETLIDAFAVAYRKIADPVHLVIAGDVEDKLCYLQLEQLIEQHGIVPRVHFLGGADQGVLRSLYRGCRALIFPSRVESFGLPPLEAMAYRVPVAASCIDAVVEVCSDAALYFDPDNAGEMAEAMMRLWSDEGLRRDLVVRGVARAGQFSWEETARLTLRVIRAAATA